MNENIQDLIYNATIIGLFILAVTLVLFINMTSINMKDAFNEANKIDKTVYESSNEIHEVTMAGSDIIYKIYNGLESDIEIGGIEILKSTDVHTFDFSTIEPLRQYQITNRMNDSGEIIRVIFH
ncbi:MAG: hypothetical protein CVU84_06375 [Firmicutes bacterium HGW-Firmicutes-1]|jgi:hypothetical protein|nr:MAG: hypothetical protein CVU84_06375 [Firmicutes bacterium HGW-Firmicutes-1]